MRGRSGGGEVAVFGTSPPAPTSEEYRPRNYQKNSTRFSCKMPNGLIRNYIYYLSAAEYPFVTLIECTRVSVHSIV